MQVLAYADDLVFLAQGLAQVTNALRKAEEWCLSNSLEINRAKSGIMRFRAKHDRMPKDEKINGYPVVPVYKYLGLEIKDSGIVA